MINEKNIPMISFIDDPKFEQKARSFIRIFNIDLVREFYDQMQEYPDKLEGLLDVFKLRNIPN